ncbi:CYTH domain-containing protein [Actinoplanes sp. NPDC049548]|uniref:class IV adenylate cyclase n=1 Tax=Actinoplanes sp. NPDC049548 TaxID=3155152 RepID=UPI0034220207
MSGEVEVKYRVIDPEVLHKALAARGIELSPPSVQDDQAYAPCSWSAGESRIGVTFVRLRAQDGRCTFTTKTPVDNVLACVEHETVVDDRDQMHQAIMAMGYVPTVRFRKTRRTAAADSYALCVDEVDGLGAFLEVEALTRDTDDMARVQRELAAWVDALGVAVERTGETYDQLVRSTATS